MKGSWCSRDTRSIKHLFCFQAVAFNIPAFLTPLICLRETSLKKTFIWQNSSLLKISQIFWRFDDLHSVFMKYQFCIIKCHLHDALKQSMYKLFVWTLAMSPIIWPNNSYKTLIVLSVFLIFIVYFENGRIMIWCSLK